MDDFYEDVGNGCFREGDFKTALNYYKKAIVSSRFSYNGICHCSVYIQCALCSLKLNNYKKFVKFFSKVMLPFPKAENEESNIYLHSYSHLVTKSGMYQIRLKKLSAAKQTFEIGETLDIEKNEVESPGNAIGNILCSLWRKESQNDVERIQTHLDVIFLFNDRYFNSHLFSLVKSLQTLFSGDAKIALHNVRKELNNSILKNEPWKDKKFGFYVEFLALKMNYMIEEAQSSLMNLQHKQDDDFSIIFEDFDLKKEIDFLRNQKRIQENKHFQDVKISLKK